MSSTNFPKEVILGYAGEQNARTVEFDCSEEFALWPNSAVTLMYSRPGEEEDVYKAAVRTVEIDSVNSNIVKWTPDAFATEIEGTTGYIQLFFVTPEESAAGGHTILGKSAIVKMSVRKSLTVDAEGSVEEYEEWLTRIMAISARAEEILTDVTTASQSMGGFSFYVDPTDGHLKARTWDSEDEEEEDYVNVDGFGVDDALSNSSTNPVQNQVITAALSDLESALYEEGFRDGMKKAVLKCFQNVVWKDESGKDAYDELVAIFDGNAFCVVNNLINCSTNNDTAIIQKNESYSATISAKTVTALSLADVQIIMDGNDITATAYNNGTINIPHVTGDLSITVTIAEGYELYDYIKTDVGVPANSGIITDISVSSDDTFSTNILYKNTTRASIEAMMGVRNGASGTKQLGLFVTPASSKLGYWFGGTDTSTDITTLLPNQNNVVVFKPVGDSDTYPNDAVIDLNGTEYNTQSTASGETFANWFTFFGYGTGSTTSAALQHNVNLHIGETVVLRGGIVIHDLIPANNGQYNGLYDVATDKFYYGSVDNTIYQCLNM